MSTFQITALLLTIVWLVIVVQFRRSGIVLVGGLLAIGLYTLWAVVSHKVTVSELGLGAPRSWLFTIALALVWLGLMLAYSPLADRLATRWVAQPPTLDSFRAIQQSAGKLIGGIIVAWVLGGVLEEVIARGIVLKSVAALLSLWLAGPIAIGIAVCVAAIGAGVIHLYQGPRAMVIITQLSILFGILFVVSGYN